LNYLGHAAREQGDHADARTWLEQSLALSEQLGDRKLSSKTLDGLGTVAHALGDHDLARLRYEQSLALARRVDNRYERAWALHNLGCLALDRGEYAAARAWLTQSLEVRDAYDHVGFVHMLAEFAALAAAEGMPTAALRLAGATAGLTQKTGILVQHSERGRYERWLAAARQALGEDVAAAAWAEGQQLLLDQAIACALAPRRPLVSAANTHATSPAAQACVQLTPRQCEVAALIAQGRSNRQIGAALVITERTVAAHVEHILNKLGFASRTQIGIWAAEHGLLVSGA
jgi:non-specific serine/threonine protein kinase